MRSRLPCFNRPRCQGAATRPPSGTSWCPCLLPISRGPQPGSRTTVSRRGSQPAAGTRALREEGHRKRREGGGSGEGRPQVRSTVGREVTAPIKPRYSLKFTGDAFCPPPPVYKKKERKEKHKKLVATSSATAHAQENTGASHCLTVPPAPTAAPARAASAHAAPEAGGKAARAGPWASPRALPATCHGPPGRLSTGGTPCEGPREGSWPRPAPVRPPAPLPAGPAHSSCCQEGGRTRSPLPPQPHRSGKRLEKLLAQQASEPFLSAQRPSVRAPGVSRGSPGLSRPVPGDSAPARPPALWRGTPRRCRLCGRPANTCLLHFPSVFRTPFLVYKTRTPTPCPCHTDTVCPHLPSSTGCR